VYLLGYGSVLYIGGTGWATCILEVHCMHWRVVVCGSAWWTRVVWLVVSGACLSSNSTTFICCGFAGQQVVHAVRRLDISRFFMDFAFVADFLFCRLWLKCLNGLAALHRKPI